MHIKPTRRVVDGIFEWNTGGGDGAAPGRVGRPSLLLTADLVDRAPASQHRDKTVSSKTYALKRNLEKTNGEMKTRVLDFPAVHPQLGFSGRRTD